MTSLFKQLEYDSIIDQVKGLQFSVMSPEEIERRSVAEIVTQETYDGDNPKIGGLFDPRLGVLDNGKVCPTDGQDNHFCPGYFGHIKLAVPVLHYQFRQFIIKTLKCVCWRCSKCLIDVNSPEFINTIGKKKGAIRAKYVHDLAQKVKKCGEKNVDGCGALKPDSIKACTTSLGKILFEFNSKAGKKKITLNPDEIRLILKRIDEKHYEALGFSKNFCKPEWLICTVLPVSPPAVRPSVRTDSNTRMEDDLTHKLCDIIKTNRSLKQKLAQPNTEQTVIDDWAALLQYHVATLIDNSIPGVPPAQQRSGRNLKSIRERLRSKEGRVRGNLMGKRVDFSARSVITPDPNIKIGELGVPKMIATNLTKPELITKYNIEKMTKIVRNGYSVWPGAKSYKKTKSKQLISLKHVDKENIVLEIGDIVNRHLIDDDIVLFNRQPSLHKMSMMAHKVRVMDYSTFRLNVSVTTPYNADFDGDEMNMHVPQSIQTSLELENLAAVTTQIITPAQNKPIISIVQDTLLGSYLLTNGDLYLNQKQVYDLMLATDFEGNIPKKDTQSKIHKKDNFPKHKYDNNEALWTGQQMFSMVMPGISYKTNEVDIKNGVVNKGTFTKKLLGGGGGGLIHITARQYNNNTAGKFLDDVQNLITNFMLISGFSVGVGDLVANISANKEMKEAIDKQKSEVIKVIENVHSGLFENDTGKSNNIEFESRVNATLNAAIGSAGKIGINQLPNNNRMVSIVKSGSKGSDINIAQMIGCVGQQNVDGKRIPYGFTDRTLPHFHKFDDGPSARGFVENSFIKGLSPTEFFFHAMGGREGVIDTAVKTSETGYIQRKLIKAMEDLKVVHDGSVRSANGSLIQVLYGNDGMDPIYVETQKIELIKMDLDIIYENYMFEYDCDWLLYVNKKAAKEIEDNEGLFELLEKHMNDVISSRKYMIENILKFEIDDDCHYPINIKRLIHSSKDKLMSSNVRVKTSLTPMYILKRIDEILEKCVINEFIDGTFVFKMLIYNYLSPKIIISKYKLSKSVFDTVCDTIIVKFFEYGITPGELVGTIAAQSLGEPATQMTLNTFHFAGVGAKSDVVRGVPRLKEILSGTKNMKSPSVSVFIKNENKNNKEAAIQILNSIEITYIRDIAKATYIYFDPIQSDTQYDTGITEDLGIIDVYNEFSNILNKSEDSVSLPWIFKIEFDKRKMLNKNIKMSDIYNVVYTKINDSKNKQDLTFFYSDDNAENLNFIVRMNVASNEDTNCDEDDIICVIKNLENIILNEITIKGVLGIKNVSMRKPSNCSYEKTQDNNYVKSSEWVIDTVGTNLLDILNHPEVDTIRTFSNDINEINEVLGIEAARNALINEITDLISDSGTYVNSRHIELLADTMTQKGGIMSIDRHGINKSDRGALAKCSFEETPDIITKAAVYSEVDKIKGVSAAIMLGQEVNCGTGFSDVVFDEEKYMEHFNKLPPPKKEDDIMESVIDDSCTPEALSFGLSLDDI